MQLAAGKQQEAIEISPHHQGSNLSTAPWEVEGPSAAPWTDLSSHNHRGAVVILVLQVHAFIQQLCTDLVICAQY